MKRIFTEEYRRDVVGPLASLVSSETGVTVEAMLGTSRTSRVTEARHRLWWHIRHKTELSYTEIGALMGGRNHTTILAGVRKGEHSYAKEARKRAEILAKLTVAA